MTQTDIYEGLVQDVCVLDRATVIERLAHFKGNLQLDFSPAFLHSCDTDRLRHMLLAALWACRLKEESVRSTAATRIS
jgi:hypothetical protein